MNYILRYKKRLEVKYIKTEQSTIEKIKNGKRQNNINIKKWYLETFNDDLGLKINENANFNDIDYYEIRHIYDYLGNDIDSIIRERVFEKLASLLNISYNEIYDIWLS